MTTEMIVSFFATTATELTAATADWCSMQLVQQATAATVDRCDN
jgi:hypothetical protein